MLSEKIVELRRDRHMSQQELADELFVSRETVAKWEENLSQPDAINVLALSKILGVTADYLLNDDSKEFEAASKNKKKNTGAGNKMKKLAALCVSLLGILGNIALYVTSRFIPVPISSKGTMGHSCKLFISNYNLEILVAVLCVFVVLGILYAVLSSKKGKK